MGVKWGKKLGLESPFIHYYCLPEDTNFYDLSILRRLADAALSFFDESLEILFFFNSLPNDKILDFSKLKAFADDRTIRNWTLKYTFVEG